MQLFICSADVNTAFATSIFNIRVLAMLSAEKMSMRHLSPGKQEPPNWFGAVVYLTKHSASHKAGATLQRMR